MPADGSVATSTATSSSASQPPATSTGQFLFQAHRTLRNIEFSYTTVVVTVVPSELYALSFTLRQSAFRFC